MKTFKTLKIFPYGYQITIYHDNEIVDEGRYTNEAAAQEVDRLYSLGYVPRSEE